MRNVILTAGAEAQFLLIVSFRKLIELANIFLTFFHVYVCVSLYMNVMCMQRKDVSMGSSGTGVTSSSEQPCGCWEPNSSPLEEQSSYVPFLQHHPPNSTIFIVLLRE